MAENRKGHAGATHCEKRRAEGHSDQPQAGILKSHFIGQ
jgi:hypothetical protein